MDNSRSILVVGTDPMLLETRRLLLDRGGFRVAVARGVEEAEHLLRTSRVTLLVFFHTLSAEQRNRVVAAAHETKPHVLTVLLAGYNMGVEENDVFIRQTAGPRQFLETIQSILH